MKDKQVVLMEKKKEGWESTGQFFGFSEIWKKGDERILYDPNTGKWGNQYTIDTTPQKKKGGKQG